ncbi:uncharacterized protein F4812DRAFT_457288 [Daldinia caldariorum]|uniref:uncharacterized protein n=1 Tax=Daldinia caldariorum TaxID=326644 RepID=UPI002007859C|nr:uncharacterized protein F4812DRAFT_457288 [Daldinia caldariorum]KAI1469885.1 hypothetical protein F4812DRAFT_457288 [Daldinia caldariorum]
MSTKSLILCFLAPLVVGFNLSVPAPTGPFGVGTTVLEITDYSRLDPSAPTSQPRKLAVGVPNGFLHNIITQACLDAPVTQSLYPLLLFNPAMGVTRLEYSDTLIEIASYGYTLASVDHPYESSIVEYSAGSVVYGLEFDASPSALAKLIDTRTADLKSVLDAFSNSTVTDKIPGYSPVTKFKTDKVGVFGHSLGGATALQVMINDMRFAAGANVDSSFGGEQQHIGTEAPFMIVAAKGHNRTSDESWNNAWKNLRGFKRQATVKGTVHNSFTDVGLLTPMLEGGVPSNATASIGTIDDARVIATYSESTVDKLL